MITQNFISQILFRNQSQKRAFNNRFKRIDRQTQKDNGSFCVFLCVKEEDMKKNKEEGEEECVKRNNVQQP